MKGASSPLLWTVSMWEKVGVPVMIIICFAFPFFVGSWSFTENVLLWRIFGNSNSAHHMVIIWSMGAFFLSLVYLRRFPKVLALFSLLIVVSVHELLWWLVDWFFIGNTVIQGIQATPLAYLAGLLSGYLFPLSVIVAIFWFAFRLQAPWRLVLWTGGFYVLWAAIGFPVSVNFSGPTAEYSSLWANGVEWASWIWALAGFYLLELRKLTTSQSLLTKPLAT